MRSMFTSLDRRRELAPVLLRLFLAAILIYGIIRFRAPIEPPLVALAAAGVVLLWERRFRAPGDDGSRAGDHGGDAEPSLGSRVVRRG